MKYTDFIFWYILMVNTIYIGWNPEYIADNKELSHGLSLDPRVE